MNNKRVHINELMDILELDHSVFNIVPWKTSFNEAVKRLDVFKKRIKKQKRVLAVKYHPDKPGGNINKMKEINSVIDALLDLRIKTTETETGYY